MFVAGTTLVSAFKVDTDMAETNHAGSKQRKGILCQDNASGESKGAAEDDGEGASQDGDTPSSHIIGAAMEARLTKRQHRVQPKKSKRPKPAWGALEGGL